MAQLVIPSDGANTQLSENITSGSTVLKVADVSGFSSGILSLGGKEIVTYSATSGNTFTGVTRGTNGTTARLFVVGTTIAELESMATEAEVAAKNPTIEYQDEGTPVLSDATSVNFIGAGVTVTDGGGGEVEVTIPGGSGFTMDVQDDGVFLATDPSVIDFVGAGVTATTLLGTVTVTISGVPAAHAASHKNGGSDEILLNEFGEPTGSVEFNQQQSLQFRLENRTSDPGSPAVGQIWLRTDL